MPEDRVFEGPAICISGLGHATVQYGRFLPKGNGGDSATILIPRGEMLPEELVYYAALFNCLHRWRFSFGRKGSKWRIQELDLSPVFPDTEIDAGELLSGFSMKMRERMSHHERVFLTVPSPAGEST